MSARPTEGLRREVLPNGVTLIAQRRRTAPATALVTHVRAGFFDEPDHLVGVSHVLEHMIFKGTPSVGPGELARRTKALGGALNAYTAYDRTVYHATVPAANTHAALALQADAVRNPSIDPDALRRELGVIVQEARRKLDTPSAVAGETLHELLYDEHRIRRWRIGTEQMLEAFTRDDIAGYHASRYVPGRVIAVLVGDVDEDAALDMLRETWYDFERPVAAIDDGPAETSPATMRVRRLQGDVAQAELVIGWRGTGPLHDDAPALELAAALLSTGRGARLTRLLRDPGIVGGVGATHYGAHDVGVFAIGADLDPRRTGDALDAMGGAIADLSSRLADQDELDRVRTMLQMQFRRGLERYEGRATALAGAEAHGDVTRLDRREDRLLAVTPGAVRDVAIRRLRPDAASAVGYFPAGSPAPFGLAELQAAMNAGPLRPAAVTVTPATERRRAAPATVRQTPHGVLHVAAPHLDVLVARHGDVPQVTIGVWRRRIESEDAFNAGLAALAMRSMLRGTSLHDAAQLALAMESLGGSLGTSLGADTIGFGATVLAEHAPRAADLLAEVLLDPRFDAESVAIERSLLIEDARAVSDDAVRFPFQLVLGAAFADRGYGAPTLGTPGSLAELGARDLAAWHERMLHGGRTTVVAVGDVDPERLGDTLIAAFADVGRGQEDESLAASGMQVLRPGIRIEHRDRKQSAFAMLFPGPARTSPDRFAAETWGAIAGGLGGQLFDALRDRRSLAYTVMASSWQRRRAGALLTYIATAPERLDEARAAMLEELAHFRRDPPSEADTARATAMLAGQAEVGRQTSGAFASEIADAWLLGEGLLELDDPGAPYRRVTAADVHRVAAVALDPASRAEGVLAAQGGAPQ